MNGDQSHRAAVARDVTPEGAGWDGNRPFNIEDSVAEFPADLDAVPGEPGTPMDDGQRSYLTGIHLNGAARRKKPTFGLLRYFSLTSAVAVIAASFFLAVIYRQNAVGDLIHLAEHQNAALAQSFANTIWPRYAPYLTSASGMDGDALRARHETQQIHATLKALIAGLPVLKVKIYTPEGLTVYSSEPSQMGVDKSEKPAFIAAAQSGQVVSKLSFRGTFSAFEGTVQDRYLVESYLPIRRGEGPVEGVFELYSDVTDVMNRIEHFETKLVAGPILIFGLLYGVLLLIVRRADRILKRQHLDLQRKDENLRASNIALRRREEALAETKAQLQTILENMAQGLIVLDENLNITRINERIIDLSGLPAELLRPGASLEDAVRYGAERSEYGPGEVEDLVRRRLDLVRSGLPELSEVYLPSGRIATVGQAALPGGGYVLTYTDITEHQRAEAELREGEARLRAITESAHDAIIMMDGQGKVAYWNPAAETMLGYTAEEATGKPIHSWITPGCFRNEATEGFSRFSKTGRGPIIGKTLEVAAVRKDGTEVPVELSISALEMKGEWRAVGIMRDISEHKRAERALKESQEQLTLRVSELEEARERLEAQGRKVMAMAEDLATARDRAEAANLAKSEFLATMSHEIRTPMNGVLGMTGLLLETDLGDAQRELVQHARDSANSLLTIINDILDLSKLEAGKLELADRDFDFEQTLGQVLSLLAPRARERAVEIETRLAPDLPRWLRADRERLRQILFNLIGNAIKFTEGGKVTISGSHRTLDRGELELRCEVRDTGIGVAEEVRDKLFTRFSQADGSISRRFGGTGLGLSICQQLATLMGGDIGFESTPGEGSVFRFTIRCRPGGAPDTGEADVGAETLRDHGPLRILVAEDHHVNRILVHTMLGRAGHQVDMVSNGLEAVEAVQSAPYDVVLMDIQMPEKDGLAATREIRRMPGAVGEIPIVALTANAMAGDREKYLAAGINDYVSKPIVPQALFGAIARACATAHAPPAAGPEAGEHGCGAATDAEHPPRAEAPAKARATRAARKTVPLFDQSQLEELRDTLGEESFHQLLSAVPRASELLLKEIQEALGVGELATARRFAHDLKGMAGNLAASRIAAIAQDIEIEVRTVEAAARATTRLEDAIKQTRHWLRKAG